MDTVLIVVVIIIGLFIIGLILWGQFRQTRLLAELKHTPQEVENLRTDVRTSLTDLRNEINTRLQAADQTVNKSMTETLKVVGDVSSKLGAVSEASKRIFEIGKDISSLQETLQSPKLRGEFGELMLSNLLSQMLPQQNYSLQYTFKSGERVDAVIKVGNYLLPIDAKFPLEDFKRLWGLEEAERTAARKQFIRAVKKHIDSIAGKYILPDEGTYDFAFMYVPAENVYYEIILKEEASGDEKTLNEYALKQRVFPVSPNTFYAHLVIIMQGLRGMQVEQRAQEIMELLSKIHTDFSHFRKEFERLGKNIGWAQQNYQSAGRHLDKLDGKLSAIEKPKPSGQLITPE